MSSTAKAKTAKLSALNSFAPDLFFLRTILIVRTLLDFFSTIPDSQEVQIRTLTDNIAWAKAEKRIFLKHSLETRLVGMCVSLFLILPHLNLTWAIDS